MRIVDDTRREPLTIRITPEEKETVRRRADAEEESVSDYVRQKLGLSRSFRIRARNRNQKRGRR